MVPTSKLFTLALLIVISAGFGCRHSALPASTEVLNARPPAEKAKAPAQRASTHHARKQYLIEVEVLALPNKAYAKMDEALRAQLQNGAEIPGDTVASLMNLQPDVRVLLRPRLLIADGEDGSVVDEPDTPGSFRAEFSPASRPDGSVHLKTAMTIPATQKRPLFRAPVPAVNNVIEDDRTLQPSPDRYFCLRPNTSAGDAETIAFLKITPIK